MSKDIILGESPRNWARDANLLADPVTAPAPLNPVTEVLRRAMNFDSSLKVRPMGHGMTASKIWKWG